MAAAHDGMRFADFCVGTLHAILKEILYSEEGTADNEDRGDTNRGWQLGYKGSPCAVFEKIIVSAGMVERIRHRHHFKAQRYLDPMFFIFGTKIIHRKILFAAFARRGAIFVP